MRTLVKQHKESIEGFRQGGRDERIASDEPWFRVRRDEAEAPSTDLDGDRTNSLFSRVGKPDASGTLVVSTQLYIENEFE